MNLIDIDDYNREEVKFINKSLDNYNQLPNETVLKQLNFTLNKTVLRYNKMCCLNFLASRTKGTFCGFRSKTEPMILNHPMIIEQGKPYTFKIVLGDIFATRERKVNQISVNDKALSLRDSKARFKEKMNKSGWNKINILIDVTLEGRTIQKEKTFCYLMR